MSDNNGRKHPHVSSMRFESLTCSKPLTENDGDDADSRQTEAGEESQSHKHDVGVGKRA